MRIGISCDVRHTTPVVELFQHVRGQYLLIGGRWKECAKAAAAHAPSSFDKRVGAPGTFQTGATNTRHPGIIGRKAGCRCGREGSSIQIGVISGAIIARRSEEGNTLFGCRLLEE